MNTKISFIGCGNMAKAMIGGIIKSGLIKNVDIIASNPTNKKLLEVSEEYHINTTTDNKEAAKFGNIIILSVKPYNYEKVINEIRDSVDEGKTIVSIAAGKSTEFIKNIFNKDIYSVRVMPNTPSMVGEGMSAICAGSEVPQNIIEEVSQIFKSFGKVEIVDEKLMNAVTAVSGSSPAMVYMFIEAIAQGGILCGLSQDKAYTMAAQSVLGSARMALESSESLATLRDNVCSPGGTTIESVFSLEKNNFKGTVMDSIYTCFQKAEKMSNEGR